VKSSANDRCGIDCTIVGRSSTSSSLLFSALALPSASILLSSTTSACFGLRIGFGFLVGFRSSLGLGSLLLPGFEYCDVLFLSGPTHEKQSLGMFSVSMGTLYTRVLSIALEAVTITFVVVVMQLSPRFTTVNAEEPPLIFVSGQLQTISLMVTREFDDLVKTRM
jgi:hypothetical protein